LLNSSSRFKPQVFYWHREAKNSNTEVDYVIQKNDDIFPKEVKSGLKEAQSVSGKFL